ncbi:unnamed protein product, partial [Larinioides sclopetarius]
MLSLLHVTCALVSLVKEFRNSGELDSLIRCVVFSTNVFQLV